MISLIEQNSLKLAVLESMNSSNWQDYVLRSKTLKQIIDILAIAYSIMFLEAILKLSMPRTKI